MSFEYLSLRCHFEFLSLTLKNFRSVTSYRFQSKINSHEVNFLYTPPLPARRLLLFPTSLEMNKDPFLNFLLATDSGSFENLDVNHGN